MSAAPQKSRTLPRALVIGAPKAGTTTLCATLMRHPDVWMYPRKETHFFNDYYESRGLDWYSDLFTPAPPGALVMEGTPDYAMSNNVEKTMARIAKHIPKAQLIFMVRNPVDRIESHYVQMVSNTRNILPLPEALNRWPEIVSSSDYPSILAAIHQYFPPDQVLVLFLDDYAADKDKTHLRVLKFLNLPTPDAAMLAALSEQETLHQRANQGMDGAVLARLRRSRHFDRLNMAMPDAIVRTGKRLLRRKLDVPSKLAPQTRMALESQFEQGWTKFQNDYRV